ncbi:MAG: Rne/Rng family ribonuclease [Acidobacteriota bacterium]
MPGKQEILITRDPWQTRIGVLEDGKLVEYFHEPSHMEGLVGNIYTGRIKRILPGMASTFIDVGLDRDGFLFEGDMVPDKGDRDTRGGSAGALKRLNEGDRLLVQVIKEPMGSKGARLTTQISIPGHYLIFLPYAGRIGVSRKINGEERANLKQVLREKIRDFKGGYIVRTAAEGAPLEDLLQEMQSLSELWALIKLRAAKLSAPALVHQEADAVSRVVREILIKGEGDVLTDDPGVERSCLDIFESLGIDGDRVRLWRDKKVTLFEKYQVDQQLERAMLPRVWLPSGGCIVVQSTEALVSIDVNSGKFVGKKSLEDTASAINLEAVDEIVRQLRLRSLGGIIVIDFIDMTSKSHRDKLFNKLHEALKKDRSRSRILNISEFGLVEMTRKRSHKSLERIMTATCPCCDGRGRIISAWRTAQQIVRELRSLKAPHRALVGASPDVIRYMEENTEWLGVPPGVRFDKIAPVNPARFEIRPNAGKERD